MKIYIFGNGNISFEDFIRYYKTPLEVYFANKKAHYILCDFRGVDTLMMEVLKTVSGNVTMYHIGERPRYLPDKYKTKVSAWAFVGGFEDDASRDEAAIAACTHFLAIDFNSNAKRESGTSRNIKKCQVFHKIAL